MTEHQRRRWVARKIILYNLAANAIGYFLVGAYFAIGEGKSVLFALQTVLTDWQGNLLALLWLVLALIAIHRATAPLRRWYLAGQTIGPPSRRIRLLAVNVPAITAAIALLAWGVRGMVNGGLLFLSDPARDWSIFGRQMLVNAISGGIAASIAFFGTERLWEPELRFFFPDGHVSSVTGGWRMSLQTRMVGFLVLGNLALIALAVFINQSLQFSGAPDSNWQAVIQRVVALEAVIIIAALVTSGLLALTIFGSFIRAVRQLLDGMEAVKQGHLDRRLEIYLPDEFSRLADGFNEMVATLRQEETLRSLLDRYVTPEVARHVLEHGAQLGGQQVEGVVLFADLRDFTRLSTHLTPADLLTVLNEYFNTVNQSIISRQGIINKFGGDSLLAIWAPPLSNVPNPAQAAIGAAQDMFYRVDALNARLERRKLPPLRIGIGIASGTLVVGHVGNTQRMEFTAIGASVNLASRLQTLTKTLRTPLLFDATTAHQVETLLAPVSLGSHPVRGWDADVSVYTLPQYAPSPLLTTLHRLRKRSGQTASPFHR